MIKIDMEILKIVGFFINRRLARPQASHLIVESVVHFNSSFHFHDFVRHIKYYMKYYDLFTTPDTRLIITTLAFQIKCSQNRESI